VYSLPSAAEPLSMSFSTAFTEPTFQRIISLAIALLASLKVLVVGLLPAG
jgi:hypothetical protein